MFAAQIFSLTGSGVATVALALLAYDLAGGGAATILGTIFALKMLAYVVVSPLAEAAAVRFPRTSLLVTLDFIRAGLIAVMPFVTATWQVYVLVLLVSCASAAFTPAFQAAIPDVLPTVGEYTNALSLSRVAYDLEQLLSPLLAGAALLLISFDALFWMNAVAFVVSGMLIASLGTKLRIPGDAKRSIRRFAPVEGVRRYLSTPRLRGLMALNAAVAAAGAVVIVNTVVYVRGEFDLGEAQVALALAVSGGGSIAAALLISRLLLAVDDRRLMLTGAVLASASMATAVFVDGYAQLLAVWLSAGFALSLVQTPAGRLLQRSAEPPDRPQL